MDDRLQQAPIGVLEVQDDGAINELNAVARDLLDVSEDVAGEPLPDVYPQSVEDTLPRLLGDGEVTATEFEEYYPAINGWLAVSVVPGESGTTVYVQDVTALRTSEQTVNKLRTERTHAVIIDELIADVVTKLVNVQSREAILEAICEAFGEADLYEFAWVGDRELGTDELSIQAAAGDTGQTFAAVRDTIGAGEQTPEEQAVKHNQVEVVQPLAEATDAPERIRRAGFADGIQSLVAIPLVHGANSHGVVGVYASHATAFSDRERTSFEALSEIAGFAVTAARNRNLLHANSVTEVTFEVGKDSVLAALSAATDAKITLNGIVPQEDSVHGYLSISGATPGNVVSSITELDRITDSRIVRSGDTGGRIEVTLNNSSLLLVAASFGATVQQAVYEDGTGNITVDLPSDADLRRLAHAASREVAADVAAKRQRDRPKVRALDVRTELTDRLTDRQETVLRTAYLADYFESPRGSTAEEVAASLDITGSTLLHHLRTSQRKLLDAVFDNHDEPARNH